jgi:hypothetical protein
MASQVHRGFVPDFVRYACNSHPLLVLYFADKQHPFSIREQRVAYAWYLARAGPTKQARASLGFSPSMLRIRWVGIVDSELRIRTK